jgi:predicted RNase H-like HicB family nuclease
MVTVGALRTSPVLLTACAVLGYHGGVGHAACSGPVEEGRMLSRYIKAAMAHATIERLDDGTYYGEIPPIPGVWADGPDQDTCRATLQEVLEEWLMVSLDQHLPIPPVDGITLAVHEAA